MAHSGRAERVPVLAYGIWLLTQTLLAAGASDFRDAASSLGVNILSACSAMCT